MIPRGLWLATVLAVSTTAGEGSALVPLGATWQWARARAEGSAPPEAWRQVDFDDSTWARSPSGFTFDAYGYEASVIADPARDYSGLFLRARFDVSDRDDLAWLFLRLDWNGGFVAYLNGVEVARRNLLGPPGSVVPVGTAAEPRTRGVAEVIDLSEFIPQLAERGNVLAIQWHNSVPLGYGVGIVPELLANVTRGPFLQATATNSQTIVWQTPFATVGRVEYGPTPALGETWEGLGPETDHVATLTDLVPGSTYYYRVINQIGDRVGRSPLTPSRTFSSEGPVHFVVTADVGQGTSAQQAVARVMRNLEPDLVVINGDLVYPSYRAGLADLKFFSLYRPQMQSTPFFAGAGNHDVVHGDAQAFFAAFHPPTNDVSLAEHALAGTGPGHYFSFEHGDAHFAVLYAPLQMGQHALTPDSAQIRWLERDLATSSKRWKFLFLHLPLMSSGPHADDDYNANQVRDTDELASLLLPLAQRAGVQMIFSAHDHDYERFLPVGGVYSVVSGGGGGFLYLPGAFAPSSVHFDRQWHVLDVRVAGDQLTVSAIDWSGRVFDRQFVRQSAVVPGVYPAAWHSPVMLPATPGDGDGNFAGQTFDFAGAGVTARSGEYSNLGRLWVNYDHRFLYVGLEQATLAANQEILVFLEGVPEVPLRSNLIGLGDGILDPSGEGADGLDYLENIAFAGFSPTVAAIVGDEYADGTRRDFRRTNTVERPWPTPTPNGVACASGQGAFRLDRTFSTLPGARLQQFDRSPQSGVAAHEQNADFIQIAIPMAAMGTPFNRSVKLAAVIAAAYVPDPGIPARPMDSGFFGTAFDVGADGIARLAPVEFLIGPDLDSDDDGLTDAEEEALALDPTRADTDRDGLPDGWEVRHGLNPRSATGPDGADGDPDGDRQSNLAEFRAGTAPNDAGSVFRLRASLTPDWRLRLVWTAVPERRYWIEEATGIGQAFGLVAGLEQPVLAVGGVEERWVPLDAASPGTLRLLRVRVEPE